MSSDNGTIMLSPNTQELVNIDMMNFFLTFNLLICGNFIAALGIVGNVIIIVIFSKEGFQDSVNITLTVLAVSDLGALVTQAVVNVLVSPFWNSVDLPFLTFTTFSTQFFYPKAYFIRVSGLITAFATLERCLCVVLPMKVKSIVTRNVAIVVNSCICAVLLLYLFPVYYVSFLDWIYISKLNQTKITILYRNNPETVLRISYPINDLFVPYLTFFMLILCNSVIVVKLKAKSKWRQSVTGMTHVSITKNSEISPKEKRLVVMLSTVSTIFILCLSPQSAMLTALGIVRELKLNGLYFDVSLLVYSFTFLLETINCSVNIIVYYSMSSKFRERIQEWFSFLKTK